jgi:RNA polymerase sigma factor (sigma-70 family)
MILFCSVRDFGPCPDLPFQAIGETAAADDPKPGREQQVVDLYDQLRPGLLSYLCGLGLSRSESEDVVQESFLRLFDHLTTRKAPDSWNAWIFRVAHNLAIDLFRRGQRYMALDNDLDILAVLSDASPDPEQNALHNEELRRVQHALQHLTQQQRSAVLLRAEELRYREIASVMGVSTKRVCELVHRALALLAGDL